MGREEKTVTILAIDPSGSFKEGSGTTGWSILTKKDNVVEVVAYGELKASDFDKPIEYWDAHCALIDAYTVDRVVFESYILYAAKAKAQINSEMETCQLIGIIKHFCYVNNIPCEDRTASMVKNRWSDRILEHKGICITGLSGHVKDSIRHGMHCMYFGGAK